MFFKSFQYESSRSMFGPVGDSTAARRPESVAGRPSGFTLNELMVVVSIMAVLASMLLPAVSATRRIANVAVCASNTRQIYIGIAAYANEYQDAVICDDTSGNIGSQLWWQRLSAATGPNYQPGVYRNTIWTCPFSDGDIPNPQWRSPYRWDAHYALNQALIQQFNYSSGSYTFSYGAVRQCRLRDQSPAVGLLADSPISRFNVSWGGYYFLETWNNGWSQAVWPLNRFWIDANAHCGGVNIGYCDGRVVLEKALTPTMLGPAR